MTTSLRPVTISGSEQISIAGAIGDIVRAAARWRLWSALAVEDIRQTYRRTFIGVFWISLSFAIFVIVKVFVFGAITDSLNSEYFGVYLLLGFFGWQFMSLSVNSGTQVFVNSELWIRSDPIELPAFVFQSVARNMFELFMTGLVAVAVTFYLGFGDTIYSVMVFPAIIVYLLNAFWVSLLLGVICTRFRDLTHLISAIMRVMFFLTPIFWFPDQMPEEAMAILYWNPFSHFIWILRTPVLDQQLAVDSWIVVGAITAVGWAAAMLAYATARRRLVFWF
ncbi:ABC transporter permease [Hyphobacterium sp.]|uniref:ABC transporter permease n=1 Tax=Hyphobacterium sp. TaxID=2004662 RepID=UPI00374A4EE7